VLNFKKMIAASRHSIKQDLLAYGENDLAKQIDHLSDDNLNKIGELAARYIGLSLETFDRGFRCFLLLYYCINVGQHKL
jgi:hypothetical protein